MGSYCFLRAEFGKCGVIITTFSFLFCKNLSRAELLFSGHLSSRDC
jgi:hypothetical protein